VLCKVSPEHPNQNQQSPDQQSPEQLGKGEDINCNCTCIISKKHTQKLTAVDIFLLSHSSKKDEFT